MPTKHIDDLTWKKVQEEHVKAVVLTKTSFKDTEILKILIKKGLENIKDEDYLKFASIKNSD
jgi:rstR-like phage repressor protein